MSVVLPLSVLLTTAPPSPEEPSPSVALPTKRDSVEPEVEDSETSRLRDENKRLQEALIDTQAVGLVEARQRLAEAREEEGEARAEAKAATAEVETLRAGKLIQYGITAGVGVAVHAPFVRISGNDLRSAAVSAAPYVLFVPGYWRQMPDSRRLYCASSWGGGNSDVAQEAAEAAARLEAARRINNLVEELRLRLATSSDLSAEELETLGEQYFGGYKERTGRLRTGSRSLTEYVELAMAVAKSSGDEAVEKRQSLISAYASHIWQPGRPTSCVWSKFGVWAGFPTGYRGRVRRGDDIAVEDINPRVAFGLSFTPNAYVSLLAGFSYATFDTINANSEEEELGLWTVMVALGGNLDLFTVFDRR